MIVLLTILKVLGIVLLFILVILLLLTFVPFRYKVKGSVTDPEEHEDIPFKAWKDNASFSLEFTWLLHFITASYFIPREEKLQIKVLGIRIPMEKFRKKVREKIEEEEEKEEERERSLEQMAEELGIKADQAFYGLNYYHRTLTGSCGRKAMDKAFRRMKFIARGIAPRKWSLTGTVGLGDPYRSGKICEICSIMYPFAEDRLDVQTEWNAYRMYVHGEMEGFILFCHLLRGAFPLLFDKNCKKLLHKIRRGKKMIAAYGKRIREAEERGQNG